MGEGVEEAGGDNRDGDATRDRTVGERALIGLTPLVGMVGSGDGEPDIERLPELVAATFNEL